MRLIGYCITWAVAMVPPVLDATSVHVDAPTRILLLSAIATISMPES